MNNIKWLFFSLILLPFMVSCVNCKNSSSNKTELFRARNKNLLFGYLDRFDKEKIPFKYNEAYQFYEGLALVSINGKYGFINDKDSLVIPMIYDWASSFGEFGFNDRAIVKIINEKAGFLLGAMYLSGGTTGLINKKGEIICPMKYIEIFYASNGLARVNNGTDFLERYPTTLNPYNGKYGFIDENGKEIIPCVYDYASMFSNNLAAVYINNKWGFIDTKGSIVIPIEYDSIIGAPEKEKYIRLSKDNTSFIYDIKAKKIITSE